MAQQVQPDEARRLAHQVLAQLRADSTLADYARKQRNVADELRAAGLQNAADTLQRIATERGWSKRTFYAYRAAVIHGLATRLIRALNERDRARKAGHEEAAATARHQVIAAAQGLAVMRPDPSRQHHLDPDAEGTGFKGAPGDDKRRKRRSLVRKPETWRWDLIRALPREDRLPVLVMACTGCRPVELERGVQLEVQGRDVVARIRGAKVRKRQGQPERTLYLSGGELVEKLRAYLLKYGARTVRQARSEKLRSTFRRVVAGMGWKGQPVSYYSFRHQFSSDLKGADVDEEGVAAALGHRTDRVQRSYGDSRTGGGRGVQLAGVETTYAVKHIERASLAPGQRLAGKGSPFEQEARGL